MPVGRPDYWYGQLLVFEEVPTDGRIDAGPTSDWAHDHGVDPSAHHVRYSDAEALVAMGDKADDNPYCHDKGGEGLTEHHALTGLQDDDHQQYLRADGDRLMFGSLISAVSDQVIQIYAANAVRYSWRSNYYGNVALAVYKWATGENILLLDNAGNLSIAGTFQGVDLSTPMFTHRTDVLGWDRSIADFPITGAWTVWDLTGIIPVGAKAVLVSVAAESLTAGLRFRLRRVGDTGEFNVSGVLCSVVGIMFTQDVIVACSATRCIEYYRDPDTWIQCWAVVRGWWK